MDEIEIAGATQIAQHMVKSGFFQDTRELSQAVVKVIAGREYGIGPIAAMQGLHIVKGRVVFSANLIAALIKKSGRYNYRIRRMDDTACVLSFFEDGQEVGRSSFSLDDAKRAGLTGKDVWRQYPRNMLFARAMSNGARWYCPDIFAGGVYTREELDGTGAYDLQDAEPVTLQIEPPALEVEQPEPPTEPEPPAPPAPTNGDRPAWYRGEPTGKQARVSTSKWQLAAVDLGKRIAYYQTPDGQPDFFHMTGAAGKCGLSVISDDNVADVVLALEQYAAAQH